MKISMFIISLFIYIGSYAQPSKDFLMGREDITKNKEWTRYNGMHIQRTTLTAFKRMQSDALRSSVKIEIVSGYRSFSRQKYIWERKWRSSECAQMPTKQRALHILRYSSMPGTSRHHWGTDIDINSVSLKYFQTKEGRKVYEWLSKNASKYGFHQPYISGRSKGYSDEPWHWSFSQVANKYHNLYLNTIVNGDIKGFLASEIALEIDVIDGWVNLGASIREKRYQTIRPEYSFFRDR